MPTRSILIAIIAFAAIAASKSSTAEAPQDLGAWGYAIVVSKRTHAVDEWAKVVATLQAKYPDSFVITYDGEINDAAVFDALKKHHPRYTCFVATPAETTRRFVADVHVMTRAFDDDSYTDTLWGVLTGYDAVNAQAIAAHAQPLTIAKVASGTEFELNLVEEGLWYCELVKGKMVKKEKNSTPSEQQVDGDTTHALVSALNDYQPDCFITSGHATERDWMIGFRYKNGFFKSKAGEIYGEDTKKQKIEIDSPNPKVYLPIGNCLMGNINGPDAMALAWMNDAGVHQMMGYTVPTWYGYPGWGALDYFIEQPGRYTFAQACFASQHAMMHRIESYFPDLTRTPARLGEMYRGAFEMTEAGKAAGLTKRDGVGLHHDRDVVTFYGDPAWTAKMADHDKPFDQTLTQKDGVYTFTIIPRNGEKSFDTVNNNGTQRGGRPLIAFLPHRVAGIEMIEGGNLNPIITDDFILVPRPAKAIKKRYVVKFKAKPL